MTFLFIQLFYVMAVGMMSVLFGWTAANPGVAASRMILFIPGGFILGGITGPLTFYQPWVVAVSHVFPLTWEFHFQRDIIARGAGLGDISALFGAFLLYLAAIAVLLILRFRSARRALLHRQVTEARHREKFKQLAGE